MALVVANFFHHPDPLQQIRPENAGDDLSNGFEQIHRTLLVRHLVEVSQGLSKDRVGLIVVAVSFRLQYFHA